MPKFQIQYKYNSKTHVMNLDSDSWQNAKEFAQTVINGEITEIREFVHEDNKIKKDDKDYISYYSIFLKDNTSAFYSFKLPKVKKSLKTQDLENLILTHLKVNNKKPYSARFTIKN